MNHCQIFLENFSSRDVKGKLYSFANDEYVRVSSQKYDEEVGAEYSQPNVLTLIILCGREASEQLEQRHLKLIVPERFCLYGYFLPLKAAEIPLSAFSSRTTSKIAGSFFTLFILLLNFM